MKSARSVPFPLSRLPAPPVLGGGRPRRRSSQAGGTTVRPRAVPRRPRGRQMAGHRLGGAVGECPAAGGRAGSRWHQRVPSWPDL